VGDHGTSFLLLSLAVVVHSVRVMPVQSSLRSFSTFWTMQLPFKNVCTEVLCSDHVAKVLQFTLPCIGYRFSVCADLIQHKHKNTCYKSSLHDLM